MRDSRSKYVIKMTALQRYLMWYPAKHLVDHIRIAEFPKSGGTWLGQMVAEMAGVDFPRNTWMSISRGVQHSHLPGPIGNKKTILLVRDGRDVIVSAYHHFIIGHDHNPGFLTQLWRDKLQAEDPYDVKRNLSQFIRLFFTEYQVGGKALSWNQHLNSFDLSNPQLLVVKYEDLLQDCNGQLDRISRFYNLGVSQKEINTIVDKYSFENITKRKSGTEDKASFMRKGIAGDWKNYFSSEALTVFNEYAHEGLTQLDYQ